MKGRLIWAALNFPQLCRDVADGHAGVRVSGRSWRGVHLPGCRKPVNDNEVTRQGSTTKEWAMTVEAERSVTVDGVVRRSARRTPTRVASPTANALKDRFGNASA